MARRDIQFDETLKRPDRARSQGALIMAALIGTAILVPLGIARAIAAMQPEQAFGIVALVAAVVAVLMPAREREINTRPFLYMLVAFFAAYVVWPPYVAITLPALPFITPGRALLFALLVGWIFTAATARSIHRRLFERLSLAKTLWISILILIVFEGLAIPYSPEPAMAAKAFLDQGLSLFLPLVVAVTLIDSERDIDLIARVLLIAAVFIGLTVVYEAFTRHNIFVTYLSKLVSYRAPWLDEILRPSVRMNGTFRTQGPFTVPLSQAEFFTLLIPFALNAFDSAKNGFARLGAVLMAALFEFAIISADSRTAMVTSVFLIGLYAILRGAMFLRANPKADLKPLMMLFVAFVVLCVPVALVVMLIKLGLGETLGEHGTRGAQLALGIPKILIRPFIGYGPDLGGLVLGYRPDGVNLTIDNYYLSIALDAGLPALLAFIVLLSWMMITALIGALRAPIERGRIYLLFLLYFIGFALVRTTLSQSDNLSLSYIMMGVFAAYHGIASRAAKQEAAEAGLGDAGGGKRRRSRAWRVARPLGSV